MPYRRRRVVRKRRYGGLRKRRSPVQMSGQPTIYTGLRPASRRTHVFKRMAQDITLSVEQTSNQPLWSGNASLSTPTILSDDYGTWQTGIGMNFNLSEVVQASDFTSLFDRYKILGVKLKFLFQSNMTGVAGGTRAPLPTMVYSFDADDQDSPTTKSIVQVKQYAKERILNGNRSFSVFYKPRVARMVYQDLVNTAYESARAPWLDCSNTTVPHYGLKLWINNWFSDYNTSSYKLTISPTYYLALKDTQ